MIVTALKPMWAKIARPEPPVAVDEQPGDEPEQHQRRELQGLEVDQAEEQR